MRRVCESSVLSSMTFGMGVFFIPKNIEETQHFIAKGLIKELERLHTHCLRQIVGAFKTTQIDRLIHEAGVLPLEIYCRWRVLRFQAQILDSKHWRKFKDWREKPWVSSDGPSFAERKDKLMRNLEGKHPLYVLDSIARDVSGKVLDQLETVPQFEA